MISRLLAALALVAVVIGGAAAQSVRTMPFGSVEIPAGGTSADIDVIVNGDTASEQDEPYTVTITSPTLQISQATATGTIINDDGVVAPVISVSAPTTVQSGTVLNVTLNRGGDRRSGDRVRWAVVPLGATGVAEDDFPAVFEDNFDGSSLGNEWCASDATDAVATDCPLSPEGPIYGSWESTLATVSGGSLRLGIDHDTGTWTTSQVVSKRAFGHGLLKYAVQFPAGKGGAHAIWRAPEDHYYGPGPRSGQIVDAIYLGKTAGDRNKTWLSQLQYSGPDEFAEPAIAGQINDGTVWSAASRTAQTRWWKTDADGKTRFAFRLLNTVFWQPVEGDWPSTLPVTTDGQDEDGNYVQIFWPGGGAASPFDRPMRIVMQSGVGDADSVACSGETSCPDAATLDGANVLVDYVRYYQFPTGEAIFQPGQDQVTVRIDTRNSGVAGTRNLRFIAMDADDASISASVGRADVAVSTVGDPGIDHGEETYFLDFGLNAGGFTDEFGTTWANGNEYVTGGTAISDIESGGVGGHTTDIESPPDMTGALIVSDVCPGDDDWPEPSEMAGRNVKITVATNRTCNLPLVTNDRVGLQISGTKVGGTSGNKANNVWVIGGHFTVTDSPASIQASNALRISDVAGTAFIEGMHIDLKGTCRDAISTGDMGASSRVVVQNSILTGTAQCSPGPGGASRGHGDCIHTQGGGSRHELKVENTWCEGGFQGFFIDNAQAASHGVTKFDTNHVYISAHPTVGRVPFDGCIGCGTKIYWSKAPTMGITFNETYINLPNYSSATLPDPTGYTAAGCSIYAASAGVTSGAWCKGQPKKGNPAPAAKVGRNYDRTTFLGSGTPPTISGARVPRLDHTRLTGSTMQIVIPVDTTRGRQRLVTLGFSARDESAAGERTFSIAGAIVRPSYDIFANAGARDTETRLAAPVTVGEDGFLRLTLTGITGDAQINWMTIQRPTISVTLDKAEYVEGETITATMRREGPTEATASMGWAVQGIGSTPTSGADFAPAAPSGTATWASGVASRTASFTAVADGAAEPAEGFSFALTGGIGVDIDPTRASASATIAASSGTVDPCSPGGVDYPCDEPPDGDVCRPDGAVRGSPIRVTAGQAIRVRKAHLVAGLSGAVRGLDTTCAKANVCWGEGGCNDPKGLQADNTSTPYLSIDTAGRFPDLQPGQRALDTFVYRVCARPSYTVCTPVIADVIVTAPRE